jgi:hypothetical protein
MLGLFTYGLQVRLDKLIYVCPAYLAQPTYANRWCQQTGVRRSGYGQARGTWPAPQDSLGIQFAQLPQKSNGTPPKRSHRRYVWCPGTSGNAARGVPYGLFSDLTFGAPVRPVMRSEPYGPSYLLVVPKDTTPYHTAQATLRSSLAPSARCRLLVAELPHDAQH